MNNDDEHVDDEVELLADDEVLLADDEVELAVTSSFLKEGIEIPEGEGKVEGGVGKVVLKSLFSMLKMLIDKFEELTTAGSSGFSIVIGLLADDDVGDECESVTLFDLISIDRSKVSLITSGFGLGVDAVEAGDNGAGNGSGSGSETVETANDDASDNADCDADVLDREVGARGC